MFYSTTLLNKVSLDYFFWNNSSDVSVSLTSCLSFSSMWALFLNVLFKIHIQKFKTCDRQCNRLIQLFLNTFSIKDDTLGPWKGAVVGTRNDTFLFIKYSIWNEFFASIRWWSTDEALFFRIQVWLSKIPKRPTNWDKYVPKLIALEKPFAHNDSRIQIIAHRIRLRYCVY